MCRSDRDIIRGVLDEFDALCALPHGSGREQKIADYLVERLNALGGKTHRDQLNNIWCDLPATAGREKEPPVALQAHMDMVLASGAPDYDPDQDPIRPVERNGWLCTDGVSTLGADCGAGLAVMLFLAALPSQPHPPLRLIFTAQEEVGLRGAQALEKAALEDVRDFINLDGFSLHDMIIGCAGGMREQFVRKLDCVRAPAGKAYRLTLTGFTGGHSGFDIQKGRANALLLLGELLRHLQTKTPFAIAALSGGTAFNAIAFEASAEIVSAISVSEACAQFWEAVSGRYKGEPGKRMLVEEINPPSTVWTGDMTQSVLTLLGGFANGVYAMHSEMPDTVSDSSNLGRIYVQEGALYTDSMIRSMDPQAEYALHQSHVMVASMCGFGGEIRSRYPAWRPSNDEGLIRGLAACIEKHTGRTPAIRTQHVGLEPALFLEKKPDMRCICIGMNLEGCHSLNERWELASIPPFVRALADYLSGE